MSPALASVISAIFAASAVGLAVPRIRRLAIRLDFMDRPEGYKQHAGATPYLGGAAILLGLLAATGPSLGTSGHYLPLVIGGVLAWTVGTLDDRVNLGPGIRVLAEVGLSVLLWLTSLGWEIPGWASGFNLLLTVAWVVAVTNALNLMDNSDGACSVVGGVAAAGIGVFALRNADAALAALMFGLAGACFAFLRWNLSRPAGIFLGDGGSMLVGFLIAGAAMSGPPSSQLGLGAVLASVLVVGLPALDTVLVVMSRLRRRVPVLTGGRDHLTHRLLPVVGSARKMGIVLGAAGSALAAVAVGAAVAGRFTTLWVSTGCLVVGICLMAGLELRESAKSERAPLDRTAVAPVEPGG